MKYSQNDKALEKLESSDVKKAFQEIGKDPTKPTNSSDKQQFEIKQTVSTNEQVKEKAKADGKPYVAMSFAIICHPDDHTYLPDCVNSIPAGSEIVIIHTEIQKHIGSFETIPQPEYIKEQTEYLDNGTCVKEYLYRFYSKTGHITSFSEARNIALDHVTREWVFSLDADEHAVISQTDLKTILSIGNTDKKIGGFIVGNISMTPTGEGMAWTPTKQCRIFRNLPENRWERRCHEQIGVGIMRRGGNMVDSTVAIKHVGYCKQDKPALIKKHLRNVYLMMLDFGEVKEYEDLFSMENKTALAQLGGSLSVLIQNKSLPDFGVNINDYNT